MPVVTFSAPEVAQQLGCSDKFIRNLARRHEIPCIRIGNRYKFTDEHVAAIVSHLTQPAIEPNNSLVGARSRRRPSRL